MIQSNLLIFSVNPQFNIIQWPDFILILNWTDSPL